MSFLLKRSCLFSLGLVFFGLTFGSLIIFPGLPIEIHLSTALVIGLGCLGILLSFLERSRPAEEALKFTVFALLALYLISDLPLRTHGFTQRPVPVLLLCGAGILAWLLARRGPERYMSGLAVICSLSAIAGFIQESGGALLTSDDHPAFLYRLIQLKENFPSIPFYNPLWNAGVEAREFFASGVLNFFALFSPLIYLFDPTALYNSLVLAVLFVLVPLLSFVAAKTFGLNRLTASILSILSITSSLYWYRWALSYGTMGFILSASLAPLNLAFFTKIVRHEAPVSVTQAIITAVSFTLMFLWSPITLLFLPLLIIVLLRLPVFFRDKGAWLTLGLIILLNIPWVVIFYEVSNVGDFVSTSSEVTLPEIEESAHDISKFKIPAPASAEAPWPKALFRNLRTNFLPLNPLVLFFGIAGLVLLRGRTEKAVLLTAASTAFLLGIFGPVLKPQLELERMIIILAAVLAIPAASLISDIIKAAATGPRVPAAALAGLLALSPFWLWRITSNLTTERYSFARPEVTELVSAIKQHAGEGRILFAGFTLHALGGGHVAPLPAWTGKPLMAMSYQHDRWRYTDIIPEEYRQKKAQGVFEYLDLMNVSAVVTHERFWRKWFLKQPAHYELIWQARGYQLFGRKSPLPGYFLQGSGSIISQTGNSVVLKITSAEAVVKFNYLPFLKSSDCSLHPAKVSESTTLIRITNCRDSGQLTIQASDIWSRLFLGLS